MICVATEGYEEGYVHLLRDEADAILAAVTERDQTIAALERQYGEQLDRVARADAETTRIRYESEATIADLERVVEEKDAAVTEFLDVQESRPGSEADLKTLHDWFAANEDAMDGLRRALALTPAAVRARAEWRSGR